MNSFVKVKLSIESNNSRKAARVGNQRSAAKLLRYVLGVPLFPQYFLLLLVYVIKKNLRNKFHKSLSTLINTVQIDYNNLERGHNEVF